MRQHHVFLLGAIDLVMVAVATLVLRQQPWNPRPSPVTLRCVKLSQLNNLGRISCVFWVTNHTSNNVAIVLASIQVRTGSVWSNYSGVHESLRFLTKAAPIPIPDLAPHTAANATVDLPRPPAGCPWKVKALVTEKLGGVEEATERIIHYRRMMEIRHATGDTGITTNPFAQSFPLYGHPREVLSEEVAQ